MKEPEGARARRPLLHGTQTPQERVHKHRRYRAYVIHSVGVTGLARASPYWSACAIAGVCNSGRMRIRVYAVAGGRYSLCNPCVIRIVPVQCV